MPEEYNTKRRAKIICTMGPTARSVEQIKKLALAGMNVARLNFSHETYEVHAEVIKNIKQVAGEIERPIAILQDLQGPKIRVGRFENNQIELKENDIFTITSKNILGNNSMVSTTYENLPKDLSENNIILLDDGNITMQVISSDGVNLKCKVLFGGILKNNKGINIPDLKLSTPALTEKDKQDLKFGIEHGVNYIALSFVREAQDVIDLKAEISKHTSQKIPVIAKIEKPQALDNIEEILNQVDGIMVARGDLGVELKLEKVPVMQKELIKKANKKGIIVITATQMLESMINNPNPTRAEASDVANAILDGTDAVMLSGETANGKFPEASVKIMSKIIEEVESKMSFSCTCSESGTLKDKISCLNIINNISDRDIFPQVIAEMTCLAANMLGAKAVINITSTGSITKRISKSRTKCPIIAMSPFAKTREETSLYWGVEPSFFQEIDPETINNFKDIAELVDNSLIESKRLQHGDLVIITFGSPFRLMGVTNIMKIYRIGSKSNII